MQKSTPFKLLPARHARYFPFIVLAIAALQLVACGKAQPPPPPDKSPQVILKLDDAWYEQGLIHPGWIEVFDYLNKKEVIATIGLVGGKTEDAPDAYYNWLRAQANRGHEIWNHGWCHCKPGDDLREFRGTEYAYQLDQLQKTQALAQEKLGITLTSFGAPYNATDELTARALATIPELKVWMYPAQGLKTDKHILSRVADVNIEYPVHVPDFEQFKKGYMANLDAPVLVIQGHPRSWHEQDDRFAEFQQIIQFLRERNTVFTTPTRYAEEAKAARTQVQ